MSSHFYGFYGYYFRVKMKVGQIPASGKICMDHPGHGVHHNYEFCAICGEKLIPRISEDEDLSFYEMIQEGAGDFTKDEVEYLENNFLPFSECGDHHEHLVPQSSTKAFGVYLEEDDNFVSRPPKILGIVATRKKLKKEITVLRKHYKKVELIFGFLSDYS